MHILGFSMEEKDYYKNWNDWILNTEATIDGGVGGWWFINQKEKYKLCVTCNFLFPLQNLYK